MQIITVLIPTRKRVESLNEILNSLERLTSDKKCLELVIGIDDDDFLTKNYLDKCLNKFSFIIKKVILPRMRGYVDQPKRLNNMINNSVGSILVHLADDMKINTKNWDYILKQKIQNLPNDGIFLAYPRHNQEKNQNWPLCQITSRKWYNVVDKYVNCFETDTELMIISTLLKRNFFLKDIEIHHKSDVEDQVHLEGRANTLRGSILEGSILSFSGVFSALQDYYILKNKINGKKISNNKKIIKIKVILNFILFIYKIKKNTGINYFKLILINIFQKIFK